MKRTILTWHPTRIFRLAVGLIALIYSVIRQDGLLGLAGSFLLFISITNTGCCGSDGCKIQGGISKGTGKPDNIVFEELK